MQRARIMTGMGTADEQMAVRAQRALMRRMTSHLHFSLCTEHCTPMYAGTAEGHALLAMECSSGTTSDEEDVKDEGDLPPPLEGEDD